MRGLDPRIHVFLRWCRQDVAGRVKVPLIRHSGQREALIRNLVP
jgi:hypothetical protein